MQETPYTGYAGSIWQTAYNTMNFYIAQVQSLTVSGLPAVGASGFTSNSAATTYQTLELLSNAMFATLTNAAEAINCNNLAQAWLAESISLQQIQALPLTLTPGDAAFFNNRVTAYENAQAAVSAIVPAVSGFLPVAALVSGVPTIPYAGLVEFFETFSYETAPSGLTNANLLANASGAASAFLDLANAISIYQGNNITQLYDVAIREYQCAQSAYNILNSCTSGPFATNVSGLNIWNQSVTLPAMTMCSDTLNGACYTIQLQQQAVIRNALLTLAGQVSDFIVILRQPITNQVNTTTILNGESLMDVAARTLGDFSLWENLATLNNLSPPYTGPVSIPASGIAGWGTTLLLPTPGTATASIGTQPNYQANFLGIDIYIGPINGPMPAWTGDFQTIAGYANLSWALGRRLQTTQGSLIYHPLYGSQIPPEVGAIQTPQTAGHITAFGVSSLLSDPRVAAVPTATTTITGQNLVSFSANVQPAGFSNGSVYVNAVLGPGA